MRYYCKDCESEFTVGNIKGVRFCDICPFCLQKQTIDKIPDFETPDQYKARTDKEWNGAIYTKCFSDFCKRDHCVYGEWSSFPRHKPLENECREYLISVCAQSPNPPPNDWKEGGTT
jgi:hypothetical protein